MLHALSQLGMNTQKIYYHKKEVLAQHRKIGDLKIKESYLLESIEC